jgi:hypothetical protein
MNRPAGFSMVTTSNAPPAKASVRHSPINLTLRSEHEQEHANVLP